MTGFGSIGEYDWPKITEKELRAAATLHLAAEWCSALVEDDVSYEIRRQTTKELLKCFKNKKLKPSKAPTELPMNVVVKSAQKLKTPKKVKITIELA